MKSAFATPESHRYIYPAPFPEHDDRIDREVIKAIEEGDDAPWIELRIPHSTGDMNAIADATQLVASQGVVKGQIAAANNSVFGLLVTGWSFDRRPDAESYQALSGWAGAWANECLGDARERGTAINPKAKSTGSSSGTPDSGPDEQPQESGSDS